MKSYLNLLANMGNRGVADESLEELEVTKASTVSKRFIFQQNNNPVQPESQ